MVSVGRQAYVGMGGYAPIQLAGAVGTPPRAAVLAALRGIDRVDARPSSTGSRWRGRSPSCSGPTC
ncbi:hypothetical protein ACH47X_10685 [Promicromonospora kroppenstedtii]|uniref:Uncharacterized protein n=1 Tax=Promicromonospora kroppenstedtii TaxID=440482 RepID=A0ABW7XIN4_9MICO